jgi:hypothetical protein
MLGPEADSDLRSDLLMVFLVLADQLRVVLQIQGQAVALVHSASLEAMRKSVSAAEAVAGL